MSYAEHIPNQHPNATDAEKAAQAVEICERIERGESHRKIAAEMGINRSTLYARIEMINQPLPTAKVVRVIHFHRLEGIYEGLGERAEGDTSNTDYARLRAEQVKVLQRQSQILGVETAEPPESDPDPQMDEWVAAARAESEAELERVRDHRDAS